MVKISSRQSIDKEINFSEFEAYKSTSALTYKAFVMKSKPL